METETVPLAKRVVKVIKGLNRDTDNLMTRQAILTARIGKFATLGLSVLLVAMVSAAFIISRKRAVALSRPVRLGHCFSEFILFPYSLCLCVL